MAGIKMILFIPVLGLLYGTAWTAGHTCPITLPAGDAYYWQEAVQHMPRQPGVSLKTLTAGLPAYRGPIRTREFSLAEKTGRLGHIFRSHAILVFDPRQDATARLITNIGATKNITGMAVGISLQELQQFLLEVKPTFPVGIANKKIIDVLGVHTVPALVIVKDGKIRVYEGALGPEEVAIAAKQ